MEKFSITKEARRGAIADDLRNKKYKVAKPGAEAGQRHPAPPFTTSTLQQEAARKLGFRPRKPCSLPKNFMRPGILLICVLMVSRCRRRRWPPRATISAKKSARNTCPPQPRAYKTKTKNAQEAHEAIRPTDVSLHAKRRQLDAEGARLYDLIWKRMVASQMESALFDQLLVDIASTDKQAVLKTSGSVVRFDGFLKLYQEGRDDEKDEEKRKLPVLKEGESLAREEITPAQHFTEPPPRYSEASLVKKLEELGIGRPSTYASILSVLQERGYVKLEKKRFVAESLGRIVSAFLVSFFTRYVEYDFTAKMEDELDDVSAGEREWKSVLREFWGEFMPRSRRASCFPSRRCWRRSTRCWNRSCSARRRAARTRASARPAAKGRVGLRLGRYGAYIGCSAYPECNYKRQVGVGAESGEAGGEGDGMYPKALGTDPETGEPVFAPQRPIWGLCPAWRRPKIKRKGGAQACQPAQGHRAGRRDAGDGAGAAGPAARNRQAPRNQKADHGGGGRSARTSSMTASSPRCRRRRTC